MAQGRITLHEIIYTRKASRQLLDLEEYLADRFYPQNAANYVERIRAACRALAQSPNIGINCDHIAPGIRRIGFERRVAIYFKVDDDRINIIAIHYGGHSPQVV